MTLHSSRALRGRALFGLFHNFDAPGEEVGYLSLHLFGASIGITWARS